jgi:hypothetical protein
LLSIAHERLDVAATAEVGRDVRWVSFAPSDNLLLVGFPTSIHAFNLPDLIPTGQVIPSVETHGCVFSGGGTLLCTAGESRSGYDAQLWDVLAGRLVKTQSLPFRSSFQGYHLLPHPEAQIAAAVAFSGQSEEWMYWVDCAPDTFRVYNEPEIEGVPLPCFHPAGSEFLSAHESLGLCRMRFPTGEVIGSVQPGDAFPPEPGADPEDRHFGYDICYLSDNSALVQDEEAGLYRVDLETMRIVDPVLAEIEGHRLGRDTIFLGGFHQVPGQRLLTREFRYTPKFESRPTTLRLWDASSLFGPLQTTSPDCAFTQLLRRARR